MMGIGDWRRAKSEIGVEGALEASRGGEAKMGEERREGRLVEDWERATLDMFGMRENGGGWSGLSMRRGRP
jgi:hypothetical protein